MTETTERYRESQRMLADAISARIPFGDEQTAAGDDVPDQGMLVQFAVITEWMGPDGARWLSLCTGNASGSEDVPRWQLRMLGHELVHWMDG